MQSINEKRFGLQGVAEGKDLYSATIFKANNDPFLGTDVVTKTKRYVPYPANLRRTLIGTFHAISSRVLSGAYRARGDFC